MSYVMLTHTMLFFFFLGDRWRSGDEDGGAHGGGEGEVRGR